MHTHFCLCIRLLGWDLPIFGIIFFVGVYAVTGSSGSAGHGNPASSEWFTYTSNMEEDSASFGRSRSGSSDNQLAPPAPMAGLLAFHKCISLSAYVSFTHLLLCLLLTPYEPLLFWRVGRFTICLAPLKSPLVTQDIPHNSSIVAISSQHFFLILTIWGINSNEILGKKEIVFIQTFK